MGVDKYAVVAYDKDNDYYEELRTGNDADKLVRDMIDEFVPKLREDELCREKDGEPFDWLFVEERETQKRITNSWEVYE